MTGENPKSEARRSRSRRWWTIGTLIMLVMFLFLASSAYLDTLAVETVRCEIVSAEPRTASGGGRGSVSTSEVLVETADCGPVVIDQGVDFENEEEVASSFAVGSEYEFDIGWYSRVVMKNVLGNLPSAQDYRPAS
jgi:hypothetical protein